ncbi:hypothetical protein QNH39_03265 [Neobacillus novalis]|uniref:Uncharacterized protein n=1 Tax=Neobacillus novalis TaxID=220687 RepID=A0AA95SDA2_9BACI|nr:hypothetical protein [Neobacillus novalis]WHY86908.1 hypothetical protein QNH39_03265 [Neobacillus novalis]
MIGMIPLLITAMIIIGIVVLSTKAMKRTINRKGKISYSHRVLWIFSGYVAILLICVVLAAIQPAKIVEGREKVDSGELESESLNLYEAVKEGKINQVDKKLIRKQWQFTVTGKKLSIAFDNDEYQNISIIVERKQTNDGTLEAVFYKTSSSVNGMEISELANPPGLTLTGDSLTIKNPKASKLAFTEFSSPFSVSQFTGEASLFDHDTDITHGQSILYLRIPKDLELLDQSNQDIQFVE